MNLLPEVFVKVIATTQAQCVNSPDFEVLWEIIFGIFGRLKRGGGRCSGNEHV